MKKFISVLLIFALCLGLAACSRGSRKEQTEPVENDTQEPETSKEAETEEEKLFYELVGDFLLQMRQKQVIEMKLF